MSYFGNIRLTDQYGFGVENTPMDEQRVVEIVRLVGASFVGTTIDPNFWTATTANSATATQGNNQVTLTSGTNSAGSVSLVTTRTARYVGGSSNRYRAVIQLSDAGLTNNTRTWGVRNGTTDGAWFKLAGTTLSIVTAKTGSETAVASASWNGSTTTPTLTNVNTYEIYWTNSKVYFIINGVLVHTVSATSATWSDTTNFQVFGSNVNSGNTTTCNLQMRVATIARMGKEQTAPAYFRGTTAASTQLKYAPGMLHSITLNQPTGTLITIYDGIGVTANIIAIINAPATANPVTLNYDVAFSTGLYVVTTGTWDYTIVYE